MLAGMVALGLVPCASAQQPVERHDWILLVDASGSFKDGGDRDVRNEALVQLQTLLAVAADRNPAIRREDRLRAYRFGTGVERIFVRDGALTWENVNPGVRWNAGLDIRRFGARSDFIGALGQARADLEARPDSTGRQHIILISDGDLDIGSQLRPLGAPPAREEIDAYRELLTGRTLLDWFAARDIKIHTFYARPAHQRVALPDAEIKQRLMSCSGPDIPARLFAMIEQIGSQRGCASDVGRSEGAYVMLAIAEHTGGRFYQVTDESFVSSLQDLVMPDLQSDVGIPPGTRQLYLVVRRGDTAEVKATNSQGGAVQVKIPPSGIPDIKPDGALRVDKIEAPLSAIYRLGGDLAQGGSPSRVQKLSTTGLALQWITPGRSVALPVYAGRETTIAVSLRKSAAETTKTVAAWREFFRGKPPKVTGTAQSADTAEKLEVVFDPRPPTSGAEAIVDFEYRLPPLRPGRWELSVRMSSADPRESWVQSFDDVAEIKVLPVPDLRVGTADEAGRSIDVRPVTLAPDRDNAAAVMVPAGINLTRLLEIWQPADSAARDLASLNITLTQMSLQLRGTQNRLQQSEARNGNLRVIWRSDALRVDSSLSSIEIVVDAGAGPLYGELKIPALAEPPQWTIQSGLMSGSDCPQRSQGYFRIGDERELRLSRDKSNILTHIAAPDGDLPVCLVYRWKNYQSFKGIDWDLSIQGSNGQTVDTRRAGNGEIEPQTSTWKSTPVLIAPTDLRGDLATRLRIGDQVFIARHAVDVLPQVEAKPFFCRNGTPGKAPDCKALLEGQTTTVEHPGEEPLEAFLELRVKGVPDALPYWHLVSMNQHGRFKVYNVDHANNNSVLRTDPTVLQNEELRQTIKIDQQDYHVVIEKDWKWKAWHFFKVYIEPLLTLSKLLTFFTPLAGVVTLLFGIWQHRKRTGKWHAGDLRRFQTYTEESRLAAVWLSEQASKLVTGPGDRYEFRLVQPDNAPAQKFILPARWRLNSYLVRAGDRLKVREWFSPPAGEVLRLYLTSPDTPGAGTRLSLETENGSWIIQERDSSRLLRTDRPERGKRPYSMGIGRMSKDKLRLEVAADVQPPPLPATIQLLKRISKTDWQKKH